MRNSFLMSFFHYQFIKSLRIKMITHCLTIFNIIYDWLIGSVNFPQYDTWHVQLIYHLRILVPDESIGTTCKFVIYLSLHHFYDDFQVPNTTWLAKMGAICDVQIDNILWAIRLFFCLSNVLVSASYVVNGQCLTKMTQVVLCHLDMILTLVASVWPGEMNYLQPPQLW